MIANEDRFIFITITMKDSLYPQQNKVKTLIKKGESFTKVAKELRKSVTSVRLTKNKPSFFEWAVFESVNSVVPVCCSENFPVISYGLQESIRIEEK